MHTGSAFDWSAAARKYATLIAAIIRRTVDCSRSELENLIHETTVGLWVAAPRWRGESEIGFVSTIARCVAMDARRQRERNRAKVLRARLRPAPDPHPATFDDLEELGSLVERLPAPIRDVLVMRHARGWQWSVVGEAIGTSAEVAKARASLYARGVREARRPMRTPEDLVCHVEGARLLGVRPDTFATWVGTRIPGYGRPRRASRSELLSMKAQLLAMYRPRADHSRVACR